MSEGPSVRYRLIHQDARCGARVGVLETPRGEIDLPTFMPVGTLGTVKGLTVEQVLSTGAQIILGNTYHLALRPGAEIVQELGGLHRFMGWERPILTDSGGFQIFSLAKLTKITEEKAVFRSHIDGSLLEMSPERSIEIQECLGSDIAMVLDHVIGLPAPLDDVQEASERSIRWAERCRNASTRSDQSQFAIVQGGLDAGLRRECARALCSLDFPGYAIGGLSVGEEPQEMYRILDVTVPELPANRPRYLMGVGRPEDLLNAVGRGVDMFDCVMPTRNGRNASAFTDEGSIKLRNKKFEVDPTPLATGWSSPVGELSRAYLRHLFMANEMLGPILLSLHNLAYYQKLMKEMREAILADSFMDLYHARFRGWGGAESPSRGWV
jgi:queuine tRNA-ribosyltransferase